MAHFRRSVESFSPTRTLRIIGSEYVEDHTVYIVEVSVGLYKWHIRHRYSDFHSLHEKLIQHFPTLSWSLLPKKKLFGTQTGQFVRKRQVELELYLQSLIQSLPHMPPVFTQFLDFHKYEVHGITETLAETLYENGDAFILSEKIYHMSPLQINAICTRLALPEPTCDSGDFRKDIGHLLDFVTRLRHLQIDGSTLPVGRSNINMNDLAFDLHCFKSLTTLQISGCNMDKIAEVEHLKKSLTYVGASQSLTCLKEILLIGVGRGHLTMCDENTATLLVQPWTCVRRACFSNNRIQQIDESVKLLPHVEFLDLSHNRLEAVDNLGHLSCLQRLVLANNLIRFVPSLHTKLGNVTTLDLSHNKLENLDGLAKLYSLEVLDVSYNDVAQILEVRCLGNLPCLESVDLRGNAVTASLDYRTNMFEMFGERVGEVCLDGARATPVEIDMVAVRCALNKSREAKRANRKAGRKVAVNEPTIADADPADSSGSPSSSNSRSVFPYPSGTPPSATQISSDTLARDGASVLPGGAVGGGSATSDPAQLRQKISHLQATGGTCWLRQLNQLLAENQASDRGRPDPSQVSQPASSANAEEKAETNAPSRKIRWFPLGHLERNLKRKPSEDDAAKETTEPESSRKSRRPYNFMLPETLPNSTDEAFCMHLQTLIPQRHRHSDSDEGSTELAIHIMWCTAILSRVKIETEFPGCIYVTTENVHVFNVRLLAGDTAIPRLSRTLKLPLGKMTRITVGHEGLYVLVEWASTEPRAHGVIAFLTFSSGKTDAFINSIKLAHRRSIPELDDYEDPHVVSSNGVETTLKQTLNAFEQYSDPERIRVILYLLVMVEGTSSSDSVRTSSLVITSDYIYLVRQDYCNTPLPSYVSSLPLEPVFRVMSVFPVTSRIVSIQMYDIDTIESSNDHSLLTTFTKPGPLSTASVGFIGYGVRVSFHLGEYGIQVLDVRMPTSNQRERFLSTLVRVHTDVSESLMGSPSLRVRGTIGGGGASLRDADNVSCDSSGSQRSSGRAKGRGGRKKQLSDGPSKLFSPLRPSAEVDTVPDPSLNTPSKTSSPSKQSAKGAARIVPGPVTTDGKAGWNEQPLPVLSRRDVASTAVPTQHPLEDGDGMIPSIVHSVGSTFPDAAARLVAPEMCNATNSSGPIVLVGKTESLPSAPRTVEGSASALTEPDAASIGRSLDHPVPDQLSDFGTHLPSEFSQRLARSCSPDLYPMRDPTPPDAIPGQPRSNSSSQENPGSWHEIGGKHRDIIETADTNPFETGFGDFDAVLASDSLRRVKASQLGSSRSARSSVSASSSTPDSFCEDGLKHEDIGSLLDCEEEEGIDVLRNQIVSESDIATVRLSVGEITLGDPKDFISAAVVTSSPKSHDPLLESECASHDPVGSRPNSGRSGRAVPVSLPFQLGYPSNELLDHLSEHFDAVPLFPNVSSVPLEAFMSMSGLELVNYFHQNIAIISTENEELRHVLWTLVVPYSDPTVKIPSCVLLSTKAIYFVSDYCGQGASPASGLQRSHKRYSSDSTSLCRGHDHNDDHRGIIHQQSNCHLSCGILSNSSFSSSSERKRVFRSYATVFLKDLRQVNVGMFSQTIRLTGSDERTVLACVTHSCQSSESFLNQLRTILIQLYPLPSPDVATASQEFEEEQDFYRMFSRPRSLEARQSTDARFVYPADDAVSDITYLICRQLRGRKADFRSLKLLSYLLCFQVESSSVTTVPLDLSTVTTDVPPLDLLLRHAKPRTLILTEDHLAMAAEDHVSYPLPEFARMPPARPQMEITDVRYLEFLERITLRADDAHVIVLTFTDETGEVIVDTTVDHFSADGGVGGADGATPPEEAAPTAAALVLHEVSWTLLVQSSRSRDKLIKLLSQQWEELHRGRQLAVNTLP